MSGKASPAHRRAPTADAGTLLRKARSRLIARLYRDVGGGPEDCIVLAGMARSGTTWLGEAICAQLRCRLIFEPFAPDHVSEYRNFQYHQYLRAADDHIPFRAYLGRLASGRVRNSWIDQHADYMRPRRRLIKEVRASLLLGWIRTHFPQIPLLLLIRHPCANVASFLRLDWSSERDLESVLAQPDLVNDHLAAYAEVIARARAPHQRHAVLWCVLNRVPLEQLATGGLHVFQYESLTRSATTSIPSLFEALGHRFDEAAYERLARPSRTAARGSIPAERAPEWREFLGPARVDDVLEIVEAFGLGHLYDAEGTPTGRLTVGRAP